MEIHLIVVRVRMCLGDVLHHIHRIVVQIDVSPFALYPSIRNLDVSLSVLYLRISILIDAFG